VATLKEEKESLCRDWACQEKVYKASLRSAREINAEACKRLHDAGRAGTELLTQVASLKSKIPALKAAMRTSAAQQKQLANQCADRKQSLEKIEGELAAQMEGLSLLQS